MALSKRIRHEIMRRDNHACRYCGQIAPDVKLTIDHVIPIALGGSDEPTNLVTACVDCNAGKTSVAPDQAIVDDVSADALRWAAAMKRAGEVLAEKEEPVEVYVKEFDELWSGYSTGSQWDPKPVPRPTGWRNSIEAFYRAGLPDAALHKAVRIAMAKESVAPHATFRYFCGVSWRMLDEQREVAKAILAEEDTD